MVPVLKEMARDGLRQVAGLCAREIRRICNRKVTPLPAVREKLRRVAAEHARAKLGSDAPGDELAACAAYLTRYGIGQSIGVPAGGRSPVGESWKE
jgi:hypothetical protein